MSLSNSRMLEIMSQLEAGPIEHFSDALDQEIQVRCGEPELIEAEVMTLRGMILCRLIEQHLATSEKNGGPNSKAIAQRCFVKAAGATVLN